MRLDPPSQEVVAATIGRLDDKILVLTNKNKAKYMTIGLAKTIKRGKSGGNSVIALRENERVVGVVEYRPRVDPTTAAAVMPINEVEADSDEIEQLGLGKFDGFEGRDDLDAGKATLDPPENGDV